jgi:predicted TIM-barrel fold metal-dependent hydrolase
MKAADIPKVSADAHVDEPHDLWFERADPSMREFVPRRIQANAEGGWNLVIDGSPIGWSDLSADEAKAKERDRIAAASPEVRLAMMRRDDIRGEVIYPTIGLYAWGIQRPDAGRAACEIYNDWIVERLGGEPRIKLTAMLPTWSAEMAIAEVERVGAEDSFGALLLPLVGTPDWNMPEWESLWGALAAAGKPVVMHQGTGHDMIFYRGWGSPTANLLATQSMAPRVTALLSCGGVLERYPDLHFVLVEVNAGWLAWTMSTLDEYYQAHVSWTKPTLAMLPSEYIRRQIHATFQDDPVGLHNIRFTGTECLLWGNDYPHPESTYPNSNKVLDDLLKDVDDDVARAVCGETAARLFGFDDEVLTTKP